MPNYPVPSYNRMPWDTDGTVLVCYRANDHRKTANGSQRSFVNGEDQNVTINPATSVKAFGIGALANPLSSDENGTGSLMRYVWLFPNLRDIYYLKFWLAAFASLGSALSFVAEYSVDTTNGLDGTWTAFVSNGVEGDPHSSAGNTSAFSPAVIPEYRVIEAADTALNVKSIRLNVQHSTSINGAYDLVIAHIYGEYAAGVNPKRLEIWDPSSAFEVAPGYFDWGDIPRGTTAIKTFRIKNLSASMTANGIVLQFNQNTAMSPSQVSWHQISTDGSSWSSTINIGNLAPNALSGILYVRRVTPSNAQLSLGVLSMVANATSWS